MVLPNSSSPGRQISVAEKKAYQTSRQQATNEIEATQLGTGQNTIHKVPARTPEVTASEIRSQGLSMATFLRMLM
jgi:hypothetical protein